MCSPHFWGEHLAQPLPCWQRAAPTFGNAKSFIFGSENRSNQGATANGSQAQVSLLKAFYSFLLSCKMCVLLK